MLRREEFVSGMVPKLRLANMKDVPIRLSREEYASSMEQRRGRLVVTKDAPIKL